MRYVVRNNLTGLMWDRKLGWAPLSGTTISYATKKRAETFRLLLINHVPELQSGPHQIQVRPVGNIKR